MNRNLSSGKRLCFLCGLSGVTGVILLIMSFAINISPPVAATTSELIRWGQENYVNGLWAAWLRAVGPVLIALFALSLVHLSGATQRLAGWMTLFGAMVLTTVSLIEITLYFSAWNPDPAIMPSIRLKFISAAEILAAPALFLPLGIILVSSGILPRVFGYMALVLAAVLVLVGVDFMVRLTLPVSVTPFVVVQALWWLAASIALIARSGATAASQA